MWTPTRSLTAVSSRQPTVRQQSVKQHPASDAGTHWAESSRTGRLCLPNRALTFKDDRSGVCAGAITGTWCVRCVAKDPSSFLSISRRLKGKQSFVGKLGRKSLFVAPAWQENCHCLFLLETREACTNYSVTCERVHTCNQAFMIHYVLVKEELFLLVNFHEADGGSLASHCHILYVSAARSACRQHELGHKQ